METKLKEKLYLFLIQTARKMFFEKKIRKDVKGILNSTKHLNKRRHENYTCEKLFQLFSGELY